MTPHRKLASNTTISILGAGSWGTAIAIHLAKSGYQVYLWGRKQAEMHEMQDQRVNRQYLPEVQFPPSLSATANLQHCLTVADNIVLAVPSVAFAAVLETLPDYLPGLAWLTKGLDPTTHQFFHTLIAKRYGSTFPVAMISGPSFAHETAIDLPTAITVASNNAAYQMAIQTLLHHRNLRVYLSDDLIGLQICGALKNILAIACGISDGLQLGANTKAALITRGLAEMVRLGIALGAKEQTFLGLSGVGDLVLTCTDNQSRNRRFGLAIGQGQSVTTAFQQIGQVIEGTHNVKQICQLAREHQLDLPICMQVEAVLNGTLSPKEAVQNLMSRAKNIEY